MHTSASKKIIISELYIVNMILKNYVYVTIKQKKYSIYVRVASISIFVEKRSRILFFSSW